MKNISQLITSLQSSMFDQVLAPLNKLLISASGSHKDVFIGLDFGVSSLKLAQFQNKGGELVLTHTGQLPIDFSDENGVVTALREIFKGLDVSRAQVIVVINCPKTAIRKILIPHMPKDEIKECIHLEAKNYFPFPLDAAILDFEIVGEKVEKGSRKYELLLATSSKATVNRYLGLLQKAGINPVVFISGPVAVENFLDQDIKNIKDTIAVLDLGKRFAEISIFSLKGPSSEIELVFSRKIQICGDDFTKALTGVLMSDRGKIELSLEEAEDIKKSVGFPQEGENRLVNDKISTIQIASLLRGILEQLSGEIDRCFDYCREEISGGRIGALILTGGGASLKGLAEFLAQQLGVEVKAGDPFALAIGAALGNKNSVNLLPIEVREKIKRTVSRVTAQVMAAVILITGIFVYIGLTIQLGNVQKRMGAAKNELAALEIQLKGVSSQGVVQDILYDEPYWEDVFKELSGIIPADIYLTHLSLKNKHMILEGVVLPSGKEKSLSYFMTVLEKGLFRDVALVTAKENKEKMITEFELRCIFD